LANTSVDILCIQEPYSTDGRVRGFSDLQARVIQPTSGVPMAAIIVNNQDIDILQLDVEGSRHVVAVQIVTDFCDFYLFSAYFQFSHPVEPYLDTLDKCISRIKRNNINSQIIISADVNALSSSWYSRTTDERGEMIEELIAAHNLTVLNQASRFTTFSSPSGISNIDISLATPRITKYVCDWHISPETTISDHNTILFKIISHRTRRIQHLRRDLYFNIKRSNWEPFDEKLKEIASPSFKGKLAFLPPQQAAGLLTDALQELCKKH